MKHPASSLAYGVVTALVLLAGVWWIDNASNEEQLESDRARVLASADSQRALLSAGLNARLHLVRGLAAFATSRQEFSKSEFETFARELQGTQGGIRSLQLAPNAIVTHIYPLQGNEAAMGLDLLAHTTQGDAVRRTIDSRKFVVAGPLNLIQDGYALIGRVPIFVGRDAGDETFWGFATIIIDFQTLLMDTTSLDSSKDVRYALRGEDALGSAGGIFYGDASVFDEDPVMVDIALPAGSWQLAAVPKTGWTSTWPGRLWLWLGGMALSIASGCLATFVSSQLAQLKAAADNAARLAQESETRFRHLVEGSTQGVCIQRTGKILFVNQAFADIFGYLFDEELFAVTSVRLKIE